MQTVVTSSTTGYHVPVAEASQTAVREEDTMVDVSREHRARGVVVGGGFAGMLTTRMLANHYTEVILLERGTYPSAPRPRDGTPQDRHVHLLLVRGRQILEHYFPGITEELVDGGACLLDTSRSISVLNYHGWSVRYPSGLDVLAFTRPLLDWCIRRRLGSIGRVHVLTGRRVAGLSQTGNRVTGVRCRGASDLTGDLVVDATGRFGRTMEWLAEIGCSRPRESVVDPQLGYATRLFERSPANRDALLLLGRPPDETRGGVMLPVEGNRRLVTLVGTSGDYPPCDDRGFLAFARSLRSSLLYDAITDARPVTSISGFRATDNRRRHFETVTPWPQRFVVLGDAVCSLNPIYAQGMTVAALAVKTLDEGLARRRRCSSLQRKLARVYCLPWMMAAGEDLRWPATRAPRNRLVLRLAHRYVDGIIAEATNNPSVDEAFARVLHLLDHPAKLLHPRIAWAALANAFRSTS